MATVACHLVKASHFLRRGRPPRKHPGRHCAAAHTTRPRPQSLIRRHRAIRTQTGIRPPPPNTSRPPPLAAPKHPRRPDSECQRTIHPILLHLSF